MKESIEKRIAQIKDASEDYEELKKCMCPFFTKGGYESCITCRQTPADIDACTEYYLSRITLVPLDLWTPDFDKTIVKERETVDVDTVVGIGITCDRCYVYDKCPLYKASYACGIKWDNGKPKNPEEFFDFLINTQYERVKRSSVFEKIDGGVPDAGLSGEMDRLQNYVANKLNMGRDYLSINIQASGAAKAEGGILSKIFGGGASPALPEKKPELPEFTETIELPTSKEEVREKIHRKRRTVKEE